LWRLVLHPRRAAAVRPASDLFRLVRQRPLARRIGLHARRTLRHGRRGRRCRVRASEGGVGISRRVSRFRLRLRRLGRGGVGTCFLDRQITFTKQQEIETMGWYYPHGVNRKELIAQRVESWERDTGEMLVKSTCL